MFPRWFVVVLISIVYVTLCCAKKHKKLILQSKETNPVNFIRLAVMRLIYGIATAMGLEESLSGVMNGAFVPPGVEDDDYGDFGLFDDY